MHSELIKELRENFPQGKITQQQLADYVGCSRKQIINMESGKTDFIAKELVLIGERLKIPALFLLFLMVDATTMENQFMVIKDQEKLGEVMADFQGKIKELCGMD